VLRVPTPIRFADNPQWYPKGGFHQVVQSLVNIAQSHGATFHLSSPVASVNYDSSGRATGITLADGETREADVVVVNADLVWAHNNLFVKDGEGAREMDNGAGKGEGKGRMEPKELLNPKLARRLLEKPHSCSSISFYWAMDRQIPSLNAHNIFLVSPARLKSAWAESRGLDWHFQAEDYKESFDDIFKRKSMPREPSFYVNVPSRMWVIQCHLSRPAPSWEGSDPSAAPQDKDSIVVLVPVGHLLPDQGKIRTFTNGAATPDGDSQDWDALVERARHQVIEKMQTRLGIKGLRDMIAWEGVNTPETCEHPSAPSRPDPLSPAREGQV
jgi:phytoene desaturase (3,4-didehydrolycopene-forming)